MYLGPKGKKHNKGEEKYALKGSTNDICAIGAFFNIDEPVPEGTEIEIDLDLPVDELKDVKGNSARIKVSGVVVRTDKKGIAVSFSGLKVLTVDE